METRLRQLSQLHTFVEKVDKDLAMILQNLQWDRKRLLMDVSMGTCRYDNNHKLPLDKIESHERKCFIKLQRYSEDDELLPCPLDINANTLVKLSTQQIFAILNDASRCNPLFKRGNKWESRYLEPWSLDRLQATYTADERRAIHDAVVQAVPSCHDLADLALPSHNNDEGGSKVKSRVEILAELRDMKRRRTKYRMAAKTRNYSDVLRDVIKTQMEFYSETSQFKESSQTAPIRLLHQENNNSTKSERCNRNDYSTPSSSTRDRDREIFIRNKEARNECPNEEGRDRHGRSRYYKSPIRETVRHSSTFNTACNLKRTQSSGNHGNDRHKPHDNYHSFNHEKVRNRENYKRNDSLREKHFVSEAKDRHRLSHRRNEYGEYNSSDRSERKTKEKQTQGSYRRKRNRESYTSDESEDSRISEKVSRDRRKNCKRKRSRDTEEGQSQSYNAYNSVNRSRVERIHIKSERLETSEGDPRSGRAQTSPGYTNNRNSESHVLIKQERMNSPDIELEKQRDYCKISGPISNTNNGSSAFIKVEKAEPDSQYSYSSTESECGNTEDESRESDVRIKREKVDNTDKRTRDREEQSGYYKTSKYTDRHVKNTGRRIVYLEKSSEIQHAHRDNTNSNRNKRTQFANDKSNNFKNVNRDEDRRVRYDRYGHSSDQRHRSSSSDSSSSTRDYGHDSRRHEKYHGSRDTRRDDRERGDPRRKYYDKSNSNNDKKHARSDVRDTHARYYDERRKHKK